MDERLSYQMAMMRCDLFRPGSYFCRSGHCFCFFPTAVTTTISHAFENKSVKITQKKSYVVGVETSMHLNESKCNDIFALFVNVNEEHSKIH